MITILLCTIIATFIGCIAGFHIAMKRRGLRIAHQRDYARYSDLIDRHNHLMATMSIAEYNERMQGFGN